MKRRLLSLALLVLAVLTLMLPVQAASGPVARQGAAPMASEPASREEAQLTASLPEIQHPSREEIRAKWDQVTTATNLYVTMPSVTAPYAAGQLSEDFLESGITYLNYVRFVAGLPEVTLDSTLVENAQHGAVLLAAIDDLTHYPSQPEDMDSDFYSRGRGATTTSNISARYGYWPQSCLQGSVRGCMDDSGTNNLSTLGHRRWLLNPSLGKVGFGYAQSLTGWSYIVTPVFDYSGTGCDYEFISWPVAGSHPTNLFDTEVPWSLTLNPKLYRTPDLSTVQVTITRVSDGKQWHFDSTTGAPTTNTEAYMTVNREGYGVSNCIIFHPGSRNVDAYSGTFRVEVSGIFLLDGTETTLSYDVDFFDVESVCIEHHYTAQITEPTCEAQGYTTYSCTVCGDSYVDDYVDALGHDMGQWKTTREPTCTEKGAKERTCSRCDYTETEEISAKGHNYTAAVTEPTCEAGGYTTHACTNCGHSYVDSYTDPVDHVYEDGYCKWCGEGEAYAKFTTISTSLGGNIAMNFYLELSEDLVADPEAYIQFTYAGKTLNVPLSEGILSDGVYRFSCPITSKNMTDDITAQVYNAAGPVGNSKTMDVATYCNWVIDNYTDAKTVNLMKAMLNYGASAQMLFNYRTDDLANADLAEADKVFGKVDASAYLHSRTGEEEGIKPSTYTLLLDSETTVRVYFQLTGDKTIDEYTFTVDGVEVEPKYKDGLYYIEKQNISAHRLDDLHTFTCGDITITYGGLSYVNQVMTYYTEGTTFDMASALYAYSMAAEVYIG